MGCVHLYPRYLRPQLAVPGRACRTFQFSSFSIADLKKTLAVLLDNILQRIGKLESKVDNLVNGTGANSTNSTTAVPSLVSLDKINVAGKADHSLCSHGIEPCLRSQHQHSPGSMSTHSISLMTVVKANLHLFLTNRYWNAFMVPSEYLVVSLIHLQIKNS